MKFFLPVLLSALVLFPPSSFSESVDLSTLIRKAQLMIDQEAYQAGIALLETVIGKDPKNTVALEKLANTYNVYSQQLISEGRFNQADGYLDKLAAVNKQMEGLPLESRSRSDKQQNGRVKREVASAKSFFLGKDTKDAQKVIDLNTGRELFNEAVAHYNMYEYDLAEQLLLNSIKYDKTNPYSFQLLGELASLKQDLKAAEAYYRQALAINPDKNMLGSFQKILREKKIDLSQQHFSDEHFIIRYKRGNQYEGAEIRQFLRDAYRAISQDFGVYPKNKIPVILYDRDEYLTLMGDVPHWSGAAFDGKIRLPVYAGTFSESEVRKLIHHELTHAFVFNLSRTRCPIWLNEGLSEYEENKVAPLSLAFLRDAVRRNALIDVNTLLVQDVSQITSNQEVAIFYLQSFSIVRRLIKDYRMYKMKELLKEIGLGTPFEEAFEKVYFRTFRDFAGDWRRDLVASLSS